MIVVILLLLIYIHATFSEDVICNRLNYEKYGNLKNEDLVGQLPPRNIGKLRSVFPSDFWKPFWSNTYSTTNGDVK